MILTLLSSAKVAALRDALGALDGIPGDLAELGVYRGGVAQVLAGTCPGRTVHLFDTFAGIPWDGYDADVDDHVPGDWPASLVEVQHSLDPFPNVVFHPGLFPHTAAGCADVRFALVHLDADLYASTRAGLEFFWPRLSIGGSLVLDDWHWHKCRGVDRAVSEFFDANRHVRFSEPAEHQLIVTKQ